MMGEWIHVEDKLPNPEEIVLVCDELNNFVSLGRLKDLGDDYCFHVMHIDRIEIDSETTHWMPLPKSPLNDCEGE